MTLKAFEFGDPLNVLIAKEAYIEKCVGKCLGCASLIMSAWNERVLTECARGRKVGRKSCDIYKSGETK